MRKKKSYAGSLSKPPAFLNNAGIIKDATSCVPVYLSSKWLDTVPKVIDGRQVEVLHGRINSTVFEVVCDQISYVSQEVREVLQPIIKFQQTISENKE
jgi:hypothetical protein